MKRLILIILILLLSFFVFPGKVITLTELMKPITMEVDKTRLYVTEGASIFVYALKDFKLLKKFGKEGQGPQEFAVHPRLPLSINVSTKDIIVNSLGKLSYFTKEGVFKREIKAPPNAYTFQLFNNQYIALGQAFEKNTLFNTVNIHDTDLKKIKELYRADSGLKGPGKGIKVLRKPFQIQIYEQRIILLPGEEDASINAFDTDQNKLFTVKLDCKRIKITQEYKNKVIHFFKTSAQTKDIYEALLKPISFPDYFPTIQLFFVIDKKIYVMTWKREKDMNEFYIYDMKGNFLKKQQIPIIYQNVFQPYPITIKNGKLYQLIEDLDNEEWNLHITKIN